jgi:hypothetical protein
MDIALSTTSQDTTDTTPSPTVGDDMDVENDTIFPTSTEEEIAERLRIMQEKCRESSTTRCTGKPLDNRKTSEDDVADTDNGFQKVMNKHDSQTTRKKKQLQN